MSKVKDFKVAVVSISSKGKKEFNNIKEKLMTDALKDIEKQIYKRTKGIVSARNRKMSLPINYGSELLSKHYIVEVHNVEDASSEYEKIIKRKLEQPVIKVEMTINCNGFKEKTIQYFLKSEWEHVLELGFYMA